MKFALVMQCWQTHSKEESIIGLIYKIVGCPDCDIHLFGRQYSCNPYRGSIILHTKQMTCCSYKYSHFLDVHTCFAQRSLFYYYYVMLQHITYT